MNENRSVTERIPIRTDNQMEFTSATRNLVDDQRHPVTLITYLLALVAWVMLVTRSLPMPGPEMGAAMSSPGIPEAMALAHGAVGIGLYLLVWGVMMTAMMFPSAAPAFRAYYRSLGKAPISTKMSRTAAVTGIFSLVWLLTGVASLALNIVVPISGVASRSWHLLFGVSLVVVATYQLSTYKRHHLEHCRAPFDIADTGSDVRSTVRFAVRLGASSVGCCWALMALVVVVGSMNLLWMAAITVLLSAELLARRGERLAEAIGVLFGIGGVAVLLSVLA
ncbi:DUF2182 domain-containing protein [Halomicrococcus sp. NG-SE-24]|uniref:DUF2182 domain-containing protein n=1 Tax=Halomicrococcus sp. NG-SE-24 TaxID=3436928 RepID=UPI003D972E67